MRLVVATRNAHKLEELSGLLAVHDLVGLPQDVELPPETGETFAANAVVKAVTAAAATGQPALGEDSGIESVALGGAPGVRSARYAGERASDEQNLALLLAQVGRGDDRGVAFSCALTFADAGGHHVTFLGRCEGMLAPAPRGSGGFGYDPAFIPVDIDGGRTMAELSAAEKHAISHRGRAARALRDWLDTKDGR